MTSKLLRYTIAGACTSAIVIAFTLNHAPETEIRDGTDERAEKPEKAGKSEEPSTAMADQSLNAPTDSQDEKQEDGNEDPQLTLAEIQNADVNFSSADEINSYLSDMESMPNAALRPAIRALEEDKSLLNEWLEALSLAADDEVPVGAEVVLPTVPKEEFVDFAQNSLAYGSDAIRDVTVTALSRRSDINPVSDNLVEPVTNALNASSNRYTKINAMRTLTKQPDAYSDGERAPVESVIEDQFQSEDEQLRASAVNAMLKLDVDNANIETVVQYEVRHSEPDIRQKALTAMDRRMELGLEPSPSLIASTHRQALIDLSGGMEFREGEQERYTETASYVLSNMELTETQIYEMEAAGIPYSPAPVDEGEVNGSEGATGETSSQ